MRAWNASLIPLASGFRRCLHWRLYEPPSQTGSLTSCWAALSPSRTYSHSEPRHWLTSGGLMYVYLTRTYVFLKQGLASSPSSTFWNGEALHRSSSKHEWHSASEWRTRAETPGPRGAQERGQETPVKLSSGAGSRPGFPTPRAERRSQSRPPPWLLLSLSGLWDQRSSYFIFQKTQNMHSLLRL